MMKANSDLEQVEYCLGNGDTVSYVYSPGSSIIELITSVIDRYVAARFTTPPETCYLRPDLYRNFLLEVHRASPRYPFEKERILGYRDYAIWVNCGQITVKTHPNLPWPLFYGDAKKLDDLEFNYHLDKAIL